MNDARARGGMEMRREGRRVPAGNHGASTRNDLLKYRGAARVYYLRVATARDISLHPRLLLPIKRNEF
jgi:hypothetical protein